MAKPPPASGQGSFPLNTVGDVFSRLRPPPKEFDAKGEWRATYGVFATARRAADAGRLQLHRGGVRDGRFILRMSLSRPQPNAHVQRTTARMDCAADALATPHAWTFESRIYTSDNRPVPRTHVRKSAVVEGGKAVIDDGRHKATLDLGDAHTVNWALFEAVGRLQPEAARARKGLRFVLIDHFDQRKGDQVLSYRGAETVALAGARVRLLAFDHLGRGIVPWVYFVHPRGLLVLAVSGLEAYGLLSVEPQAKGGDQ